MPEIAPPGWSAVQRPGLPSSVAGYPRCRSRRSYAGPGSGGRPQRARDRARSRSAAASVSRAARRCAARRSLAPRTVASWSQVTPAARAPSISSGSTSASQSRSPPTSASAASAWSAVGPGRWGSFEPSGPCRRPIRHDRPTGARTRTGRPGAHRRGSGRRRQDRPEGVTAPQVQEGVVGLPDLVRLACLAAVHEVEHLRVAFGAAIRFHVTCQASPACAPQITNYAN
jgi:hypothetical protein